MNYDNQYNNYNANQNLNVNQVPNNVVQYQQYSNGYYYNNNQSSNDNKKYIFIVLGIVVAAIAIILIMLSMKGDTSKEEVIIDKGTRTIMIYMVGSNLESEAGAATLDIEEIEESGINLEDNNVILYAGGSKSWQNGFENNTVYQFKDGKFEKLYKDTNKSMGSSETLSSFLSYVYQNYKTDLYDLILWDHGGGPINGFGMDEVHLSDNLSLDELSVALKNSPFNNSNKLEYIGFDACLMATVEVASVLDSHARYLVASQAPEPGFGWDYSFLGQVTKDTDTITYTKSILDHYLKFYNNIYLTYGRDLGDITLALIDLSKIDKVEEKTDKLFSIVDSDIKSGGYSRITNEISKATPLGYNGIDKSYDLVDMTGMAKELANLYTNEANELLAALDEAIIYHVDDITGTSGLSIYYPYYTKSMLAAWMKVYDKIDFSKNYHSFLRNYTNILSGKKRTDWDFSKSQPMITDNGKKISVQLDKKVLDNYQSSSYIIFKKIDKEYYIPVFKSSDTKISDDGVIEANFNGKQLFLIDADGEYPIIGYESSKGKGYVNYEVKGTLYNDNEKYGSENFNRYVIFTVRVDANNPNGKFVGVVPDLSIENSSTNKTIIKSDGWTSAEFWNYSYKILDSNGNYNANWESNSKIKGWHTDFAKGGTTDIYKEKFNFEFRDLEDGDYYCVFEVVDTQGNIHYTNILKVE